MKHLVTIVQKPAQATQIESAIIEFKPEKITLILQIDSGRIDKDTVARWQFIKTFSGEVIYDEIDFFQTTVTSLKTKLEQLSPFTHLALPLYVGLPYCLNVLLWKKKAVIINLADGSVENTSIRDCFLRIKMSLNKPLTVLKTIILPIFIYLFCRADICFYPYSPTYNSCFAKMSKTISPFQLSLDKSRIIEEIMVNYQPEYFIIGGFEYSPEKIAQTLGISKYMATTKEKALWINGEKITVDEFLCAEEVLSIFRPKVVVGTVSDAILSAKIIYPDVPCFAFESSQAHSTWGTFYNQIYKKQTSKAGVQFIPKSQITNFQL